MLDLFEMRKQKKLTQKSVAEQAGIKQNSYCNIEKGKRGVSVETAKRIATVLGFEWTKFFEDAGESA